MMHYSILPALVAVYSAFVGGLIFFRNPKNTPNLTFALLCFTTFIWQGTWAILFQTSDHQFATLLTRLGYSFIIFLPTLMYHFLASISGKAHSEKPFIILAYTLNIFLLISLFFGYFTDGVYRYTWGFYPKSGFAHPIHVLETFIVVNRGLFLVYSAFRASKDIVIKNKLAFVLTGLSFYFFAAVDYLCNFGFSFYPPGVIFVFFSLVIISYAILKLDLMHISVAITETMSSALALLLLLSLTVFLRFFTLNFGLASFLLSELFLLVCVIASALLFAPIRDAIKAPIEKRFLKGFYNIQTIILDLSSDLLIAYHTRDTIQTISSKLSAVLESHQSFYVFNDNELFRLFTCDTKDSSFHSFDSDHPLIAYMRAQHTPLLLSNLPDMLQHSIENLPFTQGSLFVPVHSIEAFHGFFILGSKSNNKSFSEYDLNMIQAVINQLIVVFDRNFYLAKLASLNASLNTQLQSQEAALKDKALTDKDLRVAQAVQMRLLPPFTPKVSHYNFEAVFRPHRAVGGDLYAFYSFSDGRIGVLLTDVIGKGVPAALLGANFKGIIDQYILEEDSPKTAIQRLNTIIFDSPLYERYMPVFYGILDPNLNTFTYCNAGHENGLAYLNGSFKSLDVGGFFVGLDRDFTFEEEVIQLSNSDSILLYTDGLNEAKNFERDDFGYDRIYSTVRNFYTLNNPDASLTKMLLEEWGLFRNENDKNADDLTVIFIQQLRLDVKRQWKRD